MFCRLSTPNRAEFAETNPPPRRAPLTAPPAPASSTRAMNRSSPSPETSLLRVALVGAPCTGKSALARELARRFGAPWVPEAARLYTERLGRELTYEDVEPIGRLAAELETEAAAAARESRLLILDTDLLSTVVYSRAYYGKAPRWVRDRARRRPADLYLLCRADLPFEEEDYQRGDLDEQRMLAAQFEDAVLGTESPLAFVEGEGEARVARAVGAVCNMLSKLIRGGR